MPFNMAMKYVNHKNQVISLGDGGPLHYFANTIRDWEWTANEVNGKVSSFTRSPIDKDLPIGIAAETEEDGLLLRDQLYEIAEVDNLTMLPESETDPQPGKLYINDWYIELFLMSCAFENYHFDDRFAEMTFGCHIPYPAWIKEELDQFFIESDDLTSSDFLDFPFDFPFDFKRPRQNKKITNDSLTPCYFLWRVYGPALNPYINIGGNIYQVNVNVPSGARLEVDIRKGSERIELIDLYGNVTNCFNSRNKESKDSGEYIWKKIPVGISTLSWDNSFNFDIVKYYERSQHPWSL